MVNSMQPYEGCKGISYGCTFVCLCPIELHVYFLSIYNFKLLSNHLIFSNFNINFHFDIIKFMTLGYIFLESSFYALFKKYHHHSFNVSVPLKVGCTAPFVLSFFLHSILFAGSTLDSFQCLRSLLIVSFHVFFGLPRPRCPTTSNSVMLLIQPSFLTTCPNQCS